MFSTFIGTGDSSTSKKENEAISSYETEQPRPKRSQVSKACYWCRTYRIKCDTGFPCRNCRIRNRSCGSSGTSGNVRTFTNAISEIDRLNLRIQELEEKLKQHTVSDNVVRRSSTDPSGKPSPSLPKHLDARKEHGGNKQQWQPIHMMTAQSSETQCYGPASFFYFFARISAYLGSILQHPHLDAYLPLNPANHLHDLIEGNSYSLDVGLPSPSLSRSQEDFYLGYYWQSFHCIYPILDEFDFNAHHQALWTSLEIYRKPSALVDIVLALCVQVHKSTPDSALVEPEDSLTPVITDRWLYRRCQAQLSDELEGPSLRTLQCHLLSVIYLLNASYYNTAHSILAQAIRIGIVLGLHMEDPEYIPKAQREYRKRIWWTLYALEMKMAMDLGRPLAVNIGQVTCGLPDDDEESIMLSNFNSVFIYEGANCFTFNLSYIKLILSTRSVYVTFYNKCAEVLGKNGGKSLYNDPQALESCAQYLSSRMEYLETWLRHVPSTLKTKREGPGKSFSTDGSRLDLAPFVPLWHQRQGIFLELLYHNEALNLYRPFISFSRANRPLTPQAAQNAVSCANHAITIINIINQLVNETEILRGWHETFHWLWNATISLIGYVLDYPDGSLTTVASDIIKTAIDVFEILSVNFSIAGSAATITRELSAKADVFVGRFSRSLQSGDDKNNNLDNDKVDEGILLGFDDGFNLVGHSSLDLWAFDQTQVDLLLGWTDEDHDLINL